MIPSSIIMWRKCLGNRDRDETRTQFSCIVVASLADSVGAGSPGKQANLLRSHVCVTQDARSDVSEVEN
jgi:hypothetical protein